MESTNGRTVRMYGIGFNKKKRYKIQGINQIRIFEDIIISNIFLTFVF